MYRKLTPKEIVYGVDFNSLDIKSVESNLDYYKVFENIKRALSINNEGYNVYIMDDFSKDKVESIIKFVRKIYNNKKAPNDICYFLERSSSSPKNIFLSAGKGKVFKEIVDNIKKVYFDVTFDFYNNSVCREKEDIMDFIEEKRNFIIEELILMAKNRGFHMKPVHNGFTFIPISNGSEMTENEYDELDEEDKREILDKISELKDKAKYILEKLKDIEKESIEKMRSIFRTYYKKELEDTKIQYRNMFSDDIEALEFIENMCKDIEENIIKNYSASYSDDERGINSILQGFMVNVLVDNTKNTSPVCIFEEDPSVQNLIGTIEYENKNGAYTTDINHIKAGTLLKCNEGCIILRIDSLLTNSSAYYHLKKILSTGKLSFNYNKGYLELLSLNALNPEPIKVNIKVILIGDFKTYDLLYSCDEEFKRLFKIRAQYYPERNMDIETINIVIKNLKEICENKNIMNLKNDAVEEIFKYLSRKVENNKKIYLDKELIKEILILADSRAKEKNKNFIEAEEIIDVVYKEDIVEKNILNSYKEEKQFICLNGYEIGQINGLSVIDGEYFRFGKPIRITCCCYSGVGNIYDVQKESNLSGNIHNKSINILKGFMNSLLGGYDSVPVDFHLSFEQLYGYLDGDSASVAEIIAIISSLSKIPINQSIAVTGSIDQFGRVQPIGGVNEKIEGYFKVCKQLDSVKGKGVIIPKANEDNLVLNREIEKAICNGDFSIYSIEDVFDGCYILLNRKKHEIINELQREIKKYLRNNKRR